jgi:hypothetical protein
MLRLTTFALAFLATLVLAPLGARAQSDCVCGVGQAAADLASEDPNISFGDAMSVMSAMRAQEAEALETPDRHTIRGIVRHLTRQTTPSHGTSILWCFHSDDPRCAPAAPADPVLRMTLRTPFTLPTQDFVVSAPAIAWREELEERLVQEADASSGLELARLLERPPRS